MRLTLEKVPRLARFLLLSLFLLSLLTASSTGHSWDLATADGSYWNRLSGGNKIALIQGFLIGTLICVLQSENIDYLLITEKDFVIVQSLDLFYKDEENQDITIIEAIYRSLDIKPKVKPENIIDYLEKII